ncbi:hypothetical protein MANES_15G037000v8 [Manihot esculenta]|uniref:Uncharacterized protein n=1 Tax=Manihot esculenta TaxID=3983 RepID=A0ACB7G9M3_MANES|nr:hypothetical protein MANES_15G037000v8 [Manihot esculenta]
MTFVATDTLSELVWYPQKGLRLRCADGSISNKNGSLLWGIVPANTASGLSSDMPISNTQKATSKRNFMASLATCNLGSEVSGGDDSTRFPTSDAAEEMKNAMNISFLQRKDTRNNKGEGKPRLLVAENNRTRNEHIGRAANGNDGNHALGMEIALTSEIRSAKECEAYDTKMQNAGKGHEESPSIIRKERKNKIVVSHPPGIFPLEKLESGDENDVAAPHSENICGPTTEILALDYAGKAENETQLDDELFPVDKTLAVRQSTTKSRIQNLKGKSRALSDGDANEMMFNEEDNSHESVESCNSAGLFPTGKRRWNFEQQLIVGSKRVKRQIQESPSSSSLIKQDSSFMYWISNMTKGFSKSSEGGVPSFSPALEILNRGPENPDQVLITSKTNNDPGCRITGFQSIFQSLFCRKTKFQEAVTLNVDHPTEELKELELDNKICDLDATPIACSMVTGNIYKRFLPSNDEFNVSTSGNRETPVVHSHDVSMNFAATQENNRGNSTVNKHSCNLATSREKGGTSFSSSQGKHKTNNVEKIDPELPFEGNTASNFDPIGDPLESLWIARFTPKPSGLLLNQDPSKRSAGEALNWSSDGHRQKPQLQSPLGTFGEHENEELLQVLNSGSVTKAPFCAYKIKARYNYKCIHKLKPILASPRFENSEAMASLFARRLDALKHFMPSDEPYNAALATTTCFFCGIKGHHLQECPEITDTELEDLLRNMNSYNGVKEMPRVCIRCFQLDHWAAACPSACSRVRNQAESDASFVNHCGPSKMQLNARIEDNAMQKHIAAGPLTICDRNDFGMERDLNLTWKSNEAANSGEMKLNVKFLGDEIASSSREKKLKENLIEPVYETLNAEISDVPRGIIDAIRMLHLSRTDILKWTNSHMSLSHLDGFFLRVRLGKWEKGLGGTGYYVACITGTKMENSPQNSKKCIAVNVGGIKCLVESQHVSNHDFLEDELVAWWSATSRSGSKLPSEEELRLKAAGKKMLGF